MSSQKAEEMKMMHESKLKMEKDKLEAGRAVPLEEDKKMRLRELASELPGAQKGKLQLTKYRDRLVTARGVRLEDDALTGIDPITGKLISFQPITDDQDQPGGVLTIRDPTTGKLVRYIPTTDQGPGVLTRRDPKTGKLVRYRPISSQDLHPTSAQDVVAREKDVHEGLLVSRQPAELDPKGRRVAGLGVVAKEETAKEGPTEEDDINTAKGIFFVYRTKLSIG